MVVIAGANIPYLDDDYEHSSNRDLDLEIDSV